MQRIQIKKVGMKNYVGKICSNVMIKVRKQSELTRNCFTIWCGQLEFQVEDDGDNYVVNLDKRTCTCGMFQLTAYSCKHACSAIAKRRLQNEDFIYDCYNKETYLSVYKHMIYGVPGKRQYIKIPWEPLKAPEFTRKMGRPKQKRRLGADEGGHSGTRKGLTTTCSNCLILDHNKRSCKNPTHPRSKFHTGVVPPGPAVPVSSNSNSQSNQESAPGIPPGSSSSIRSTRSPSASSRSGRISVPAPRPQPPRPAAVPASVQNEGPTAYAPAAQPYAPSSSSSVCAPQKQRVRIPSVTQVLQNIRDRSKEKRPARMWKP